MAKLSQAQRWRERAGLTQMQLSARADVSLKTISGWEAGKSVRTLTAQRLLDVLNPILLEKGAISEPLAYEEDEEESSLPVAS